MNFEHCANLICYFEGFRENVYLCSAGVPTFGYGSLVRNYPNQKFPISKAEARTILINDIKTIYYPAVKRLISWPLNSNQESALTSFCYNLGTGALQRSTLRRKINRGDLGVENEFLKWSWAGGKQLKGLLKRRQAEALLFKKEEQDA